MYARRFRFGKVIIVGMTHRRGRPFGHRLSEETKNKIRIGRSGTKHRQDTKDKISRSLSAYFKKRDSFAASLEYEYTNISDEALDWIDDNRGDIDVSDSIMTERRLLHLRQLEINMGNELEQLFGHNANPEFLLLLKEQLISQDLILVVELLSLI